jgi:hypothetical protein
MIIRSQERLSKEQMEHLLLRIKVAEKFGIQPVSYRASRLLNKHCPSVEEAKEWVGSKAILKVKQIGAKSIRELRCAFGLCCETPTEKWKKQQQKLHIDKALS